MLVLANQVNRVMDEISRQTILYTPLLSGWRVYRDRHGAHRLRILVARPAEVAYGAMLVMSFFAPDQFIPLAYDAGSVTTGVLTAPVIISIAIGLSSVLAGRSAISDGFGLLGFASVGPIFVMMGVGILLR